MRCQFDSMALESREAIDHFRRSIAEEFLGSFQGAPLVSSGYLAGPLVSLTGALFPAGVMVGLGFLSLTSLAFFDSLNGFGWVRYGGIAELPGHDDVKSVFHPRARFSVEGFSELSAGDERFEGIGIEDFEADQAIEKGGI